MPAWQVGHHIGVKLITAFPDNADAGLATFMGAYLLLDGRTGKPLAVLDGPALTLRRTAAASALAAGYLARADCERLLIVGTGALVAHLVEAHAAVRPIRNVLIWGRNFAKAKRAAQRLDRRTLKVAATDDLAAAVRGAHVISCATAATEPVIKGAWLPLGVHLDLVGGFTPAMREADDDVIRRGRVFVDTREAALREAGDIVQPLRDAVIGEDDIAGDLFELTRGARGGRRFHDQITVFKSVGTALEDLAAAQLALERVIN
jgi:alanine dehydrogenase